MKHAILIIAYHNSDYIRYLIEQFNSDFYFFIHWDKKTSPNNEDKEYLLCKNNVKYWGSEYSVNWGSYGIVRATLLLCKAALKYSDVKYMHLISDADMLTKDIRYFKDFFKENNNKIFLEYMPFPVRHWEEGGYYRAKYYHRLEELNIKEQKDDMIYRQDIDNQTRKSAPRVLPNIPLYGGSAWWSLPYECVSFLISQQKFIEKYFIDTLFPDEMFAQTVIMNSPFATRVVNNNLRYISWGHRNGNNPAVLDNSDLGNILREDSFFARKIDPKGISKNLISSIEKISLFSIYLNKEKTYSNKELLDLLIQYLLKVYNANTSTSLFDGNIGICIFFYCYQHYVGKNRYIEQVLDKLKKDATNSLMLYENTELEEECINLAIGWEYLLIYTSAPKQIFEILDKVNCYLHNLIRNFYSTDISEKQNSILWNYLLFRERNKRSNEEDYKIKTHLHKPTKNSKSSEFFNTEIIEKINQCHSLGLAGYSMIGLELLSQVSDLKYENLYPFLI